MNYLLATGCQRHDTTPIPGRLSKTIAVTIVVRVPFPSQCFWAGMMTRGPTLQQGAKFLTAQEWPV
jgi:hypothetical protein